MSRRQPTAYSRGVTEVNRLRDEIVTTLNTWSKTVTDGVEKAAEVTVKEMVAETKQRPHGKYSQGGYVKSIAMQTGMSTITRRSKVWYVKKPHYTLTHLLNNGHATLHGRYVGDRHVTVAAEKAEAKFEDRVKEVIRNASY